ncbi:nuclear transport factor 2 family protein [Saccharopolyspora sp. NPDC000995]
MGSWPLYEPDAILIVPTGRAVGHRAIRAEYEQLGAAKPEFAPGETPGETQPAIRKRRSGAHLGSAGRWRRHRRGGAPPVRRYWLWGIDQPNLL